MNKADVKTFFDRLAPSWDAEMIRDDAIIGTILDHAHVSEGCKVLDVATGTGVLIPDYLGRNVASVTAIDISTEMIRIAREKCKDPRVTFVAGDVETAELPADFDVIVVYNAFPHFPAPEALIPRLSSLLRTGGTLTIAHGMSRDEINARHREEAKQVSMGLMGAEELAAIFAKYLEVRTVITTDKMYQV
ncbi:MAG: class I SAM-dependent methyltransferase, partial [Lachnospiraceae bacterium]|nr:class I SAM-dependent methyltransferase [Lachnospiraceae bacterium]